MKRVDSRIRIAVEHLGLTPRESELVELCCLGYATEEIADLMEVSTNTIRTHLRNIYEYVGVHDRAQLVSQVLVHILKSVPRKKKRRKAVLA